jgi:uncharacterized protein
MDPAIIGRIAHDLGLPESSVTSAIGFFEKGATTPFIARYRKEQTGGLDEAKVRVIEERLSYYKDLLGRRASLVKMLIDQKKLSEELRQTIEGIYSKVELEDLFYLYRPKRKTRAAEAQEKGLEPLAEYLWNQETDAWSLEVHADAYKDPEKGVASAEQALQGALDIIAERIAENPELRSGLREMLWKEGQVVSTVVPAKAVQKTKYTMYYDRREPVSSIPSHRVLAIRRGTKEGVLTSAIECDQAKVIEFILNTIIHDRETLFSPLLEGAARDAYSRILRPLVETEVRAMLKERADREAIRVFQENLSNLLLSPPAGARVVMGIDVGKGNECRLAIVDEKGSVLEEAAISLRPPRSAPLPPATEPTPSQDHSESGDSQAVLTDAPSLPPLDIQPAEGSQAASTPTPLNPVDGPATESAAENVAPEAAADSPGEIPVSEAAPADSEETASKASPADEAKTAGSENSMQEEPAWEVATPVETPELQPETTALSSLSGEAPAAEGALGEGAPLPEPESESSLTAPETQIAAGLPPEPGQAPGDTSAESPSPAVEVAKPEPPKPLLRANDIEGSRVILRELIAKHSVRALAIASNASSRSLESTLRQVLAEEKIEGIVVAAVTDAGIAVYASSRIAREELPDMNVSARCAVSLARRLQDPLAELVKIDPKLIGVGQYQHDVDQKELHRGLLQAVRSCVNRVGVDPNTAGQPLLRCVAGFNDKLARRLVGFRNAGNSFPSRSSLLAVPGMDHATFEQAAGFLRIRDAENPLDRTALHPESYPVVEKMAASLGVAVSELVGNRDLVIKLRLEDFLSESIGMLTLKDIREELLRPGRDPRRPFSTPKFRADIRDIGDLKEGMVLEGNVTNVTNFGAFVDIGVRQDGLVHLSQMSNRFIRDPREAVKVGDVVQVKVISVEIETKRIGLSMKALLPPPQRRRRKASNRNSTHAGGPDPHPPADGSVVEASGSDNAGTNPAKPVFNPRNRAAGRRPDNNRRPPRRRDGRRRDHGRPPKPVSLVGERAVDAAPPQPEEPKGPEPSLQEKIALLQSRFRGIK